MTGLGMVFLAVQLVPVLAGLLSRRRRCNTPRLHQLASLGMLLLLLAGSLALQPGAASPWRPVPLARAGLSVAIPAGALVQDRLAAMEPGLPGSAGLADLTDRDSPVPAATAAGPAAAFQNPGAALDSRQPSRGLAVVTAGLAWLCFLAPWLALPGLGWFGLVLLRHRGWKRRVLALSQPASGRIQGISYRCWSGPACSFGLWHPVILLPPQAPAAMVAHEEAHLLLGHGFWNGLEQFLACLGWFNPWLQLMARQGRLARELEADARAAGVTGAGAYARSLVAAAQAGSAATMPGGAGTSCLAGTWESGLAERVRALVQPVRPAGAVVQVVLGGLLAGLVLACCTISPPADPFPGQFAPRPAAVLAADALAVVQAWEPGRQADRDLDRDIPGIDLMVPGYKTSGFYLDSLGGEVLAWADGTVSRVGAGSGNGTARDPGRYLVIDHGTGWESSYACLAECRVQPGQTVRQGEVIGSMGDNNLGNDPRLRFGLRHDGQAVDPTPYVTALDPASPPPGLARQTQVTRSVRVPLIQGARARVLAPFGLAWDFLTGGTHDRKTLTLLAVPLDPAGAGTTSGSPPDRPLQALAFSSGQVVGLGLGPRGSTTVTLRHGNFASQYANLANLTVSLGQAVRRGEVLGELSLSPSLSGTRYLLDFQLSLLDRPIDPAPWVACESPALDLPGLDGPVRVVDLPHTLLSMGFGTVADPFTGETRFHRGVDLCPDTTEDVALADQTGPAPAILAFAAGTVTETGTDPARDIGLYVDVRHANGWTSRYAHLEAVTVTPGTSVQPGMVLGTMGRTGRSTGRHLHFELLHLGEPVDPQAWLQASWL